MERVLAFAASCAPGSSIIFDYALKSFVEGDVSTHGGQQVANWMKNIGEPFLFGLEPANASYFLAERKLRVLSDFGPLELEKRYLGMKSGAALGRTFGHIRIIHAEVLRSL